MRRQGRQALGLLLPTLGVVALVAFYPLLKTVLLSFTDARLGSSRASHFVGLRNYLELVQDRRFYSSLSLTLEFALVTVALELVLGLGLALLLDSQMRGRGLVRAAVLVPWAVPTVMSTQIWKWMYHDVFGVINDLGMRLGLLASPVAWTADPAYLFGALCAVDVWKTTPFVALMLLAGLQTIPRDLYEAAALDGASPRQRLSRVTLPLLLPTLMVTLIFRSLEALRAFDLFYVMVGNRPHFQTLAVLDQQILVEFSRVGQGSALSVLIFLCAAVAVALYLRGLERR